MSFEGASTGAVDGSSGPGTQLRMLDVSTRSARLVGTFGDGTFVGSLSGAGCVYDYTLYKVAKFDQFATLMPQAAPTGPLLGNSAPGTPAVIGQYGGNLREQPAPEYNSTSQAAKQAQREAVAQRQARRGEQLLAAGRIVEARRLFERAALAGNPRGVLGLGMTYDPAFLSTVNSSDAVADPLIAKVWYLRAQMFGNKDARSRLATLEAWKPS